MSNDTGRYICKRILLALLTVFIIAAITFFAMNAIPGGPFSSEKAPSPTVKKVLEARFHLDKPLPEQFALYIQGLMQGDFGISTKTGRDIATTMIQYASAPLCGMGERPTQHPCQNHRGDSRNP